MNEIRESFLSLDLFSRTFKNIFMALLWGAIAPMDPSLTGISVRASDIHADNILLSSRLCVFNFVWFTMENILSHMLYVLSISEQKRSANHSGSGTSPLKLVAKTVRYQDASFPSRNCQLAHSTVPVAMTVTAPQASALQ